MLVISRMGLVCGVVVCIDVAVGSVVDITSVDVYVGVGVGVVVIGVAIGMVVVLVQRYGIPKFAYIRCWCCRRCGMHCCICVGVSVVTVASSKNVGC